MSYRDRYKYIKVAGQKLWTRHKIITSLKKIFGLGVGKILKICSVLGLHYTTRLYTLTSIQFSKLKFLVERHNFVGKQLQQIIIWKINKIKRMNSYKSFRHKLRLPVRGQRTRTNAQTQKKKKTIW